MKKPHAHGILMDTLRPKTILFTAFHGYISRNLLATDAFRSLVACEDTRIVIFVLAYKRDYFVRTFGRENVIIEGVPFGSPTVKRFSLVMKRIAKYCLDSESVRIQRRLKWKREGRLFYFLIMAVLSKVLAYSASARTAMRWLDRQVSYRGRYAPYFERYKPALAVATDVQNERDVEFLQNANRLGVRSIGMVRSWDNLSTHGFIRVIPDTLLVTCPRVKNQAVVWNDVPADRIREIGITHYDKYAKGPSVSRQDFFRSIGLDPDKKTILYTIVGDIYLPTNDVDPFVYAAFGEMSYQVIVRFSPSVPAEALDDAKPFPQMVLDRPGVNFKKETMGDRELSSQDDDRLMNEIAYSDVVVCGPSTIALDAIYLDKPVVLIDCYPTERPAYEKIHLYGYTHFRYVLAQNAARRATSIGQFRKEIEAYIQEPARDAQGRKNVREQYCGPSDGHVSERFVEEIQNIANG